MNRKERRIVGSIVLGALWSLALGPVGMVVGLGAYAITGESRSSRKNQRTYTPISYHGFDSTSSTRSFSEDRKNSTTRDLIELLHRGREIERARREAEEKLTRRLQQIEAESRARAERLLDSYSTYNLLPKIRTEEKPSASSFLDEHLKIISKPKIDLQPIKVETVSSFDKLNKPYEPLLEEIRRIESITSSIKPSISTGSYTSKPSTIRSSLNDLTIGRKSGSGSPTIEEAIQRIIQAED